jgi:branched-subunit amino acid aminotransferase/4-amino-4-deoxychorismate lyase
MTVQSITYKRDLPQVKHVALFGTLQRRRQAQLNGFDDALFMDDMSFISEGPTWNVGFFDGTRVIWPNADVLLGVTMQLLKQVHDQTVAIPVHLRDIPSFEAAFVTNVSVGVRPLSAIDGIGLRTDHPIIEVLTKEYAEIPHERV